MFGMTGEQFHALITGELLALPTHFEMTGPDCVELGSNFHDIRNAAMLLSHGIWWSGDYAVYGEAIHNEEVDPCKLRRVIPGTIGCEADKARIREEMTALERTAEASKLSEKFVEEMRDEMKKQLEKLESQPRRVFVKFEIALSGRNARDMREMRIMNNTRRISLNRKYEREYNDHVWNMVGHYLEAKEQRQTREMIAQSAGHESINLTI